MTIETVTIPQTLLRGVEELVRQFEGWLEDENKSLPIDPSFARQVLLEAFVCTSSDLDRWSSVFSQTMPHQQYFAYQYDLGGICLLRVDCACDMGCNELRCTYGIVHVGEDKQDIVELGLDWDGSLSTMKKAPVPPHIYFILLRLVSNLHKRAV